MPIPVRTLSVLPNPWVERCIDHNGAPAAHLPIDSQDQSMAAAVFVGCKMVDTVETHATQYQRLGTKQIVISPARHYSRWAYSKAPVALPNTGYYRQAILCGDLIAADEKTLRAAGGVGFIDPQKVLADARENAIAHFDASTGEGAWVEMGSQEPIWIEDDAPSAPDAPATPVAPLLKASKAPPAPTPAPAADSKGLSQ